MMGLDSLAATLLERAVQDGLPWATFSDVQESPGGEVLTVYVVATNAEERVVDINTMKNGMLRCLGVETPGGVTEEQVATLGSMTKCADDPGELMNIPWDVGLSDIVMQLGLFSEIVH